ncbi:MAG: hypothetical protein Q8Q35_03225, partial [Nanoarchaeota archaeon]|nr:hypothetical protein [Nanoarchaeota archaeon]
MANTEEPIIAEFNDDSIIAPDSDLARELYDKSRYGEPMRKKFQYSVVESLYLIERGKMKVFKGKKELDFDAFL